MQGTVTATLPALLTYFCILYTYWISTDVADPFFMLLPHSLSFVLAVPDIIRLTVVLWQIRMNPSGIVQLHSHNCTRVFLARLDAPCSTGLYCLFK